MRVLRSPHEIYTQLDFERLSGKRIGIVPTMGALHEGHLSLVERAKQDCDIVATTIFVNPTQFGPNEDFSKYPRTLESDLEKLQGIGCDYVFTPAPEQIYAPGHSTYVTAPSVAARWEGEIRPGHFQGVTTIVMKLFMMLPAHIAYFGQKDYQQVAVLKTMVEELNVPIRIVTCETIRESDGLAMSSRNRYLTADERQRALGLSRALREAQLLLSQGEQSVQVIEEAMRRLLLESPVDAIDYARVVTADQMEPMEKLDAPAVAIIAARLGTTRLIDNALLFPS